MSPLIKDLPLNERPRERLLNHGADALKTAELIAILLRTGTRGRSALETAELLLGRFPALHDLAGADVEDLRHVPGIGRDKALCLKTAFTLARRMAAEIHGEATLLDAPDRVADLLREEVRQYQVEHFHVIHLNTRRRLIRRDRIARGTLDSLIVHPREVFRMAISSNASAIILAHNHPSGDPAPSEADIKVTRDLIRAGQLLKIEVLDHIIIGRCSKERSRDFVSLRELGYVYS